MIFVPSKLDGDDLEVFFNSWAHVTLEVASKIESCPSSSQGTVAGFSDGNVSQPLNLHAPDMSPTESLKSIKSGKKVLKLKVCRNCGEQGHSRKECKACWGCGKIGHSRRDCPNDVFGATEAKMSKLNDVEVSAPTQSCDLSTSTTSPIRKASLEEDRICYRCSAFGHIAKFCPTRSQIKLVQSNDHRMQHGHFLPMPYVNPAPFHAAFSYQSDLVTGMVENDYACVFPLFAHYEALAHQINAIRAMSLLSKQTNVPEWRKGIRSHNPH